MPSRDFYILVWMILSGGFVYVSLIHLLCMVHEKEDRSRILKGKYRSVFAMLVFVISVMVVTRLSWR